MTYERTYQKTHPWLTFTVDLRRATHDLWILLGEARSKCDHISNTPLRPSTAADLHMLYLAKGAQATTAIEGNTLSEAEVVGVIKGELQLPQSKEYLATEINNIVKAVNDLADEIGRAEMQAPTPEKILAFNRQVLQGLTVDEGVVPGQVRRHSVGVATYRGAPSEDCAFLIEKLCEWLNGPDFAPAGAIDERLFAILKAVLAHLYLAWIHPFGDGNGRTARLLEFQILVSSGFPSPAAHLLSNHYNATRTEYYRQLQRASASGGDVMPFILYAVSGFVDGLRAQLEVIRQQQFDIAWQTHVMEKFENLTGPSDHRRQQLILDLSKVAKPVPLSQLKQLSPRVAADYATKTSRTLLRDLVDLQRMNLIRVTPNGYVAHREVILGLLPRCHATESTKREPAAPAKSGTSLQRAARG